MSDLQCPTRLFLARHGDADYETSLVTDHGGWLSAVGRAQSRELGERLRGERIARVWCSPMSRAVQTAEIAAGVLGVDVVVREGLREYAVGSLAGTDADEAAVVGPVFHRWVEGDDGATVPGGEAVLVVGHGGTTMATVPTLLGAPRATAYDLVLPGGGYVALEGDSDGWRAVGVTTDE